MFVGEAGMARRVRARIGVARSYEAGGVRQGMVRPGKAGRGLARQARQGSVRLGAVRRGMAWHGRHGTAGHLTSKPWCGEAGQGFAWQGVARLGRLGLAGQAWTGEMPVQLGYRLRNRLLCRGDSRYNFGRPASCRAAGHSIAVECCSRPDHNRDLRRGHTTMANPTPIGGGAPARNHFPQTVARLAVQASRAQLLELCRQALADGVPRDEIAAFLNQMDADCRAMIAAAYPNQNRGDA